MTDRKCSALWYSLFILAIFPGLLSAQATVSLTTSASPAQLGAPLTLNAAVTPADATGRVTFYDGVTVLGTKPLVLGVASYSSTLLPSGNRKLKAYYAGDGTHGAATSNVVSESVNALPSTDFSRIVLPAATSSLGPVADFNGDGHPDIVTFDANHQVSVLLGDGTGNFPNSVHVATPNLVDSAVVADFNGDGIPDLALLIHFTDLKLMILLGNGDGTFRAPSSFSLPTTALSLAVADFNADGIADLSLADQASGVDILLGKGDGTFQPIVSYPTNPQVSGNQAFSVIVGDFNGDGKADLVTSNAYVNGVVTIILGLGDGRFQPPAVVAALPNGIGFSISLAAADFNGDGNTDLVTVNGYVLLGKGDGTFQSPVFYPDGATGANIAPVSVVAADINGDGKIDVAFANPFGNVNDPTGLNLAILYGNGDGTFQAPALQSRPGILSAPIAGDINGDGKTDLVILRGNNVDVLLGTGITLTATAGTPQSTTITRPFAVPLQVTFKNGTTPLAGFVVTFTAPSSGPGATLSSSTVITDANGVASVMATANSLAGSYTVTATNTFTVQFNLTNLSATATILTPSPATPQSAFLGEPFPIPLQVTLTDASGLASRGVTVTFAGPAAGASAVLSATSVVTNASGVAAVTAAANNVAGSYQVKATAGNLSANFALTNLQPNPVPVTVQSSANPSNFGAPPTITVTIANPNANGQVTLFDGPAIVASKTAQSGIAAFSTLPLLAGVHQLKASYRDLTNALVGASNVFTQTVKPVAGGSFTALPPLSINPAPSSGTVAADFNADGKMDFAFPRFVLNLGAVVTVVLGKGDGTFQAAVDYLVAPNGSFFVATGDFNGDGILDLAVNTLNTPSAYVSILLGKGDGTFGAPVNYLSLGGSSLLVGDFNGDGKSDLLVGEVASGRQQLEGPLVYFVRTSLLLGKGDGAFGRPAVYAGSPSVSNAPTFTFQMLASDFNGDGKLDVAIAPSNAGPFIVLGNGDGTARAPVIAGMTGFASLSGLVTGDFNGDGKVDLAAGGLASSVATTWVLLGNGDGTFQTGVTYTPGSAVLSADFNGDGITDLLLTDPAGNTSGILQGRGDGTFQQGTGVPAGIPLAIADFNFDGRADILTANAASTAVTLLQGAPGTSAGQPASIVATGGTPQSTLVSTAFAQSLQVTVKDANGTPVSGVLVTFTAPASGSGAALSSASVVTSGAGVATVSATANNIPGSYAVIASANGLSATFSLNNLLGSGRNLALGGIATQSSNLPGYSTVGASLAIDGNTDGNFFDGSVSHTGLDANAWWQVDLGASAAIGSVVIWNRTDCCGSRLGTYWVFVSNTPFLPGDTPATIQNRAGVFVSLQAVAPNSSTVIPVGGVQGRYVRVQLAGTQNLSLAEVQVFSADAPGTSNLALGKTADQSSTLPGYLTVGPNSAIDGNTGGNFFDGSVSHTLAQANAWWQVDLGTSSAVSSIVVWNRTDCCSLRLQDYWIFVSDTPFLPGDTPLTLQNRAGTFSQHLTGAPAPAATIFINTQGRYVRVQLAGTDYLSLAEVQVFGTTGGPAPANLALGKGASQSSTLPGYVTTGASSAVDGNTDGNFFDGSVTHTSLEASPWWQVDLGATATVRSVAVWNRTDACCVARLSDYWVFVSDTPFVATDTPATLQARAGTFSSHQTSVPAPFTTINVGASGRYVRVQLNGTNNLSLAEVQVFGQ